MSTFSPIYLDHNATTPCDEEVVEAMQPLFRDEFGNASSTHAIGKRAATAVQKARELIALTVDASAEEIYFTSGATESNNIALLGLMVSASPRKRIVVTELEHKSVLEPCEWLSQHGFELVVLPTTSAGVADIAAARDAIDTNTLIVCVHGANNEIGTLQPVSEISEIAHAHGALVHCDATQLLGKVLTSLTALRVDSASLSAHKAYGPKGVGVLFIRQKTSRRFLSPVFRGGGQEKAMRPGTLNVPGIVGLGEACRIIQRRLAEDAEHLGAMRDRFESLLSQYISSISFNGVGADRLPGTSSVTISGVPASMLMANVPQLCISDGSACNSGALEPSHVLSALGLSRDDASCTIRVSFGRGNTLTDAEQAAELITAATFALRAKLYDMTAT